MAAAPLLGNVEVLGKTGRIKSPWALLRDKRQDAGKKRAIILLSVIEPSMYRRLVAPTKPEDKSNVDEPVTKLTIYTLTPLHHDLK